MEKINSTPNPYDIEYCEYEKVNNDEYTSESDIETESIASDIDTQECNTINNQFIEESNNNYSFINMELKSKKKRKDEAADTNTELVEESYLSDT